MYISETANLYIYFLAYISNDDLQLDVLAETVDSILLVGVGLHPLLQAA